MAQELVYTTTLRLHGPWLLETKQLLALDEIMGQIRSGEPAADGYAPANKKSLTIFLSKERELESSSFKEAMTHIASQNEVAKGFEYFAQVGITSALVRLIPPKKNKKSDGEEEPFFEIKVRPPSRSTSYEIFGELKSWADSVEAPLWRQWAPYCTMESISRIRQRHSNWCWPWSLITSHQGPNHSRRESRLLGTSLLCTS